MVILPGLFLLILSPFLPQKTKIEELPLHLIPFLNGLYNIDTQKLEELTPQYFYINQIPYNYIKTDCPAWTCFQEDIHLKEDLDFVQEWFGYNLYRSYPIKGFVFCIGNGNNGKSIELYILGKILCWT